MLFNPLSNFAQNKVVDWIDQNAIAIQTVNPESDNNDLLPLIEILKDKRIVALGEATHGTKEFFQMKHRMMKFLAEEMGFTLFGIEANFSECEAINNYILNGEGNPKEALEGIYFWTWNTMEVLDMIEWMRDFNIDKPFDKKIKFYGFDMQFSKGAAMYVQRNLSKVDIELYNQYKNVLEILKNNNYYLDSSIEELTTIKTEIQILHSNINQIKNDETQKSQEEELNLLLQHLEILVQNISSKIIVKNTSESNSEVFVFRDKCMAQNVNWILEHEGENQKVMLWAHNGHVNKSFYEYGPKAMGYYLAKKYGNQYYAIGLDFNMGSFRAKGMSNNLGNKLKVHHLGEAKPGSSSQTFAKCKEDQFFIDFKKVSANRDMKLYLNKKKRSRDIGAVFSHKNHNGYVKNRLMTKYDGLIFINETTSSIPILKKAGGFTKLIPLNKNQSKLAKFSIMVKCDSISSGKMWLHIKNKNKAPSYKFFEIKDRQNIWQEYIVEQMIEPGTKKIQIGFVANGGGKFYIDDVKLYFENSECEELNSSFENDTLNSKPEYWFVFDTGYEVAVTNEEKHSGEKSLLVKFQE